MTDLVSAGISLLVGKNLNEIGDIIASINEVPEDVNVLTNIQDALWLSLGPVGTKIRKIVDNIPRNQMEDYANALSTPESDLRCLQGIEQLIKNAQDDPTISAQSKVARLSLLEKLRKELLRTRPSLRQAKPAESG